MGPHILFVISELMTMQQIFTWKETVCVVAVVSLKMLKRHMHMEYFQEYATSSVVAVETCFTIS